MSKVVVSLTVLKAVLIGVSEDGDSSDPVSVPVSLSAELYLIPRFQMQFYHLLHIPVHPSIHIICI